ncbi:CGNR zinc finger domain-containing protein [Pseudomonas sp. REP124]|uniref:CGNR zinc finger domain-containing protein n=1 Tax=Pseudomonas sp. REP124 TaxID=2875731 RepID=UPI001CD02928|nr:ABATE domain-containing protein [Pseudomonas sp. REP124]MBZ9780152.1 CGNR zinc finger domain-containing protein [Pseudomonas sp. REP124]
MRTHLSEPAIFIADAPALDFLNSIATPIDEIVDWIGDADGLLDWLEQSGWVSRQTLEGVAQSAMPGELDGVAAQARALRGWFRAFVLKHQGTPLTPEVMDELATLNRLLERDDGFTQITLANQGPASLQLQPRRRWKTPESLLLPIGEVLAKFICEEDFADVKSCEGAGCTLMFVDHTRGKKRRWCSMAVCGNRAKAAAHRQRKKLL